MERLFSFSDVDNLDGVLRPVEDRPLLSKHKAKAAIKKLYKKDKKGRIGIRGHKIFEYVAQCPFCFKCMITSLIRDHGCWPQVATPSLVARDLTPSDDDSESVSVMVAGDVKGKAREVIYVSDS